MKSPDNPARIPCLIKQRPIIPDGLSARKYDYVLNMVIYVFIMKISYISSYFTFFIYMCYYYIDIK
jgi:hypothetical protein